MSYLILIQLFLAHVLVDFVFQTNNWVKKKNEGGFWSVAFASHVLLSGLLAYLFVQQWGNWWVPLITIITHAGFDFWKIEKEKRIAQYNRNVKNDTSFTERQKIKKYKSGTAYFFIDQALHIVVILGLWLALEGELGRVLTFLPETVSNQKIIAIVTALIFVTWPVGIAIGKITEPFRKELKMNDSLNKAGQYIGTFERLLVFVFILIGQYQAIGFLIASKSILRITKEGDKDARKKTEYVLIGTLLSFTIAIAVGLLIQHIV